MFRSSPSHLAGFLIPTTLRMCSAVEKSPFTSHFARDSQKTASRKLDIIFAERVAIANRAREAPETNQQAESSTTTTTTEATSSSPKNNVVGQPQIFKRFEQKGAFTDPRPVHDTRDASRPSVEVLRKRLIFQSRYRGMAELDLVLGSFAQTVLPQVQTEQELVEYDAILRQLDTDLFHWLVTVPGRNKDAAAAAAASGSASMATTASHKQQTAQSILAGTSDYAASDKVPGATPADDFVEPKELLEAEWHRRDEVPEALLRSSMWRRLVQFVQQEREAIVAYR